MVDSQITLEINTITKFFNRALNRGCLVDMFSLRFSGSKFFEATGHSFPKSHNIISAKCNH